MHNATVVRKILFLEGRNLRPHLRPCALTGWVRDTNREDKTERVREGEKGRERETVSGRRNKRRDA